MRELRTKLISNGNLAQAVQYELYLDLRIARTQE